MRSTLPATFSVKVRGGSFVEGYPALYHRLAAMIEAGEAPELVLVRDADNPHDPNAVSIRSALTARHIGHLPREVAARFAPEMDAGAVWAIESYEVLVAPGHEDHPGLLLSLRRSAP